MNFEDFNPIKQAEKGLAPMQDLSRQLFDELRDKTQTGTSQAVEPQFLELNNPFAGFEAPKFGRNKEDETDEDGNRHFKEDIQLPGYSYHEESETRPDGYSRDEYSEKRGADHTDYFEEQRTDGSSSKRWDDDTFLGAFHAKGHSDNNADGTYDREAEFSEFGIGSFDAEKKDADGNTMEMHGFSGPFQSIRHSETREDSADGTHTYTEDNRIFGTNFKQRDSVTADGRRTTTTDVELPFGIYSDHNSTTSQDSEDDGSVVVGGW